MSVDYLILKQYHAKGIVFKSFDDFWNTEMNGRQLLVSDNEIDDEFKEMIKNNSREAYEQFIKDYLNV